jgi:hypothetical protein
MARNRSRSQRTQAKRKKLILSGLAPNQEARIDDDGKIQIVSTDIRGRDNHGVVSNLGVALNRLFLHAPPYLPAIDREYLARESSPLFANRLEGIVIF